MNPTGGTCPSCAAPLVPNEPYCAACGAPAPTKVLDPNDHTTDHAPPVPDEAASARWIQKAMGEGFEIGRLLGRGGFGSVYAARDLKLQRDVAVKVLHPDLLGSRALVERFLREARTIAQLRHPSIVPVFQVGEGEGLIWFVMPLVKGESLRALLTGQGRVPVPEARRILAETAVALATAHEAGVVHRDVKPENIMLEGWERRVQLMDFGISRSLDAALEAGLTATGMIIGTVDYMSPEQASGEPTIDHRTDIYSLGVVGYEMLAGKSPFSGDTPRAVLTHHIVSEPPDLATARPDVPPEVAAAIMRCLRKDPAERWTSARELAVALEAGPAAAAATPVTTPVTTPPRRRRRSMVLGLSGVAVAAGIVALFALRERLSRRPPDAPRSGADSASPAQLAPAPGSGPATSAPAAPSGGASPGAAALAPPPTGSSGPDRDLAGIERLIGEGRPRTALEQLDRMRERRPRDARVDALIARAVRAEVESLVVAGQFDQALTTLRGYIQARAYLEGLAADSRTIELRRIEHAVERYPNSDPYGLLEQLERAYPNDLPLRVDAAARLAGARYYDVRYAGFEAFARILETDPRQRERILPHVRADLERRWINNSTISLVQRHLYDELRPELEARLGSDNDTLRQNAYLALREADRSRHDLFQFHRKNLSSLRRYPAAEYENRVQTPLGWGISYFNAMTDSARIREAIGLLESLRGAPELSKATRLLDNALAGLRAKLGAAR